MTNKKNEEQYIKIIREYLAHTYDEDTGARMLDAFSDWFFDDTQRSEKDRIMDELCIRHEYDPKILSDNEIKVILVKAIARRHEIKPKNKARKNRFLRTFLRVAAVVLPLAIIAGLWLFFSNKEQDNVGFIATYAVPCGEISEELLGDSTKVTMNADSKLVITQCKKERVAELSGESFFSVAKDSKCPFIVKTQELTITVFGTEFNVEAYPNRDVTIVTLESGEVKLNVADGREWTLKPNQQFVYNKATKIGDVITLKGEDAEKNSAWRTGTLIYNTMTVPEVLKMIEHKFGLQFETDSTVRFTNMTYNIELSANDTPEDIMSLLKLMTEEFDYKIEDKKVMMSNPNS